MSILTAIMIGIGLDMSESGRLVLEKYSTKPLAVLNRLVEFIAVNGHLTFGFLLVFPLMYALVDKKRPSYIIKSKSRWNLNHFRFWASCIILELLTSNVDTTTRNGFFIEFNYILILQYGLIK